MQLCMENYHQSFNPTSSSIRSEPIFTRQLLLQYVSVNLLRNERRYLALVTQNPDTDYDPMGEASNFGPKH